MASPTKSKSRLPQPNSPPKQLGIGSSNSTTSLKRSSTSSALPSIRSLRKAFQFTGNSNTNSSSKQSSSNSSSSSSKGILPAGSGPNQPSFQVIRTLSGSLPRPSTGDSTTGASSGSLSASRSFGLVKSSSVGNIAARSNATSIFSPPPSGKYSHTFAHSQSVLSSHAEDPSSNTSDLRIRKSLSPLRSRLASPTSRPHSVADIPTSNTGPSASGSAYTSNIPLPQTSGSEQLNIANDAGIQHVPSKPETLQPSMFLKPLPPPTLSRENSPPTRPLPAVPDQASNSPDSTTPRPSPSALPSPEPASRANDLESSVIQRQGHEETDSENAIRIYSDEPVNLIANRPGLNRSRSALESVRAIAAEAEAGAHQLDVTTPAALTQHDDLASRAGIQHASIARSDTRSRQSTLEGTPIIMESPSRSPAVVEPGSRVFDFPSTAISDTRFTGSPKTSLGPEIGTSLNSYASRTRQDSITSSGGAQSIETAAAVAEERQMKKSVNSLRQSSSSPLSELVARLSVQAASEAGSSPTKSRADPFDSVHSSTLSDAHFDDGPIFEEDRLSARASGEGGAMERQMGESGQEEDDEPGTEVAVASSRDSSFSLPANATHKMQTYTSAVPLAILPSSTRISTGLSRNYRALHGKQEDEKSTRQRQLQATSDSLEEATTTPRLRQYGGNAREVLHPNNYEDPTVQVIRPREISPRTEKRWSIAEVEGRLSLVLHSTGFISSTHVVLI